jgi:two-component system CheB/CheR fusion protein
MRGKNAKGAGKKRAELNGMLMSSKGSFQIPLNPESGHLLIVGLGASLGGLEAVTEFLRHLPANTGMAFVLVQHLQPHHKSRLTALLAKSTSMAVATVKDRLKPRSNEFYVMPPDVTMVVRDGLLRLQSPVGEQALYRCIDLFFESLARELGKSAIGVLLSGSGRDGTLGLERIKAAGGKTFAQDSSARCGAMPMKAVEAGCVDMVLSPQKMARELANLANRSLFCAPAGKHTGSDLLEPLKRQRKSTPAVFKGVPSFDSFSPGQLSIKRILYLLRGEQGVDFSFYKSKLVQLRMHRRMVLKNLNSLEDYADLLRSDPEERRVLSSEILNSSTSFFRDCGAFEVLKSKVFPALVHGRKLHDPIRIWIIGCSTGEEVYSLAIMYQEFRSDFPKAPPLQIYATEIQDALLEKARSGFYGKTSIAGVTSERLRKYFVEEKDGYRLRKPLRDLCVFAKHDILRDAVFSRMDLISCRNLLAYLGSGAQKQIFRQLHVALKSPGFLLLGSSDPICSLERQFDTFDTEQKVLAKKAGAQGHSVKGTDDFPFPVRLRKTIENKIHLGEFQTEAGVQREGDRLMLNQFAPPGALIDSNLEVLQFRGSTNGYLEIPSGKASFNILKMAKPGLVLPLRSALQSARQKNTPTYLENLPVENDGKIQYVNLEVIPLENLKQICYLILFSNVTPSGPSNQQRPSRGKALKILPKGFNKRGRVAELERGLAESKDLAKFQQEQHDTALAQARDSMEAVGAKNLVLQSANEELQASHEELESVNGELTGVNVELSLRNKELNQLNSDLSILSSSLDTAVLLLGFDLSIRRFTARAKAMFNLLPTDIGRPLKEIRPNISLPNLVEFLQPLLRRNGILEREVKGNHGQRYLLRARSCLKPGLGVNGIVLMLLDIQDLGSKESGTHFPA